MLLEKLFYIKYLKLATSSLVFVAVLSGTVQAIPRISFNQDFTSKISKSFDATSDFNFSATLIDRSERNKVRFFLKKRRRVDALTSNSELIFQGHVKSNIFKNQGRVLVATLNIFKSKTGHIDFNLAYQDQHQFNFFRSGAMDRAFFVTLLNNSAKYNRRIERRSDSSHTCELQTKPDSYVVAMQNVRKGNLRSYGKGELQIEALYDSKWASTFPGNPTKAISTILSAAELVYLRDLGLQFNVKKMLLAENLDQASNLPEIYSGIFSYTKDSETDVVHLFSGNKLDGIFGAAYDLGTVCKQADQSASFTFHYSVAEDIYTFMHELGHNLGATHSSSLPATIMYPGAIENMLSSFHENSKAQIDQFLDKFGSCVQYDSSNNSSSNFLKISAYSTPISKKLIELKALVKQTEIPVADITVQLLYRKKRGKIKHVIQEAKTQANGWVSFIVKKRGRYRMRLELDRKQRSPVFRKH